MTAPPTSRRRVKQTGHAGVLLVPPATQLPPTPARIAALPTDIDESPPAVVVAAGTSSPRLHFPAVDGLRGAAVLSVLLYHTSWFSNGLFGVDIFMVLSGFLITLLLFREFTRTGRISLVGFYRRRFRRLMPGLSIVLLATVALSYALSGVNEARQTAAKAVASLFQFANWQQIANNDAYWQGFGRISPLSHMWSLSITEQFYVAWPLLFLILFWIFRRSVGAVTAVLFVLLGASALVAPLLYDGTNSDQLYLATQTRAVDFVAGGTAAAVVFLAHRRAARRQADGSGPGRTIAATLLGAAALTGLVTVSLLTSNYHEPWLYQGGIAMVAVVTSILIATLCRTGGLMVRLFSFGPLAEIGRISYTIYLLHLPIYWLMEKTSPTIAPYALFLIGGGITWLASMLLHYLVTEKLRTRPWPRLNAMATALVMTTAIVAGSYFLPAGVEYRLNPGNRPAILLLGDSLSENLAEALALNGTRYATVDGSISGCGVMDSAAARPLSGVVWNASKQCKIRQRLWHDALHRTPYRAIVAHFGWDAADQRVDGTWLTPCDAAYRDRYLVRLDLAYQQIQADAPGVQLLLTNERVGTWAASAPAVVCYNRIIDTFVASGKARLLDLDAVLCPARSGCLLTDPAGRRLYVDGVHLSPSGENFVARPLETKISELLAGPALLLNGR